MFKRSLLISTLALCASVSFVHAQETPFFGEVLSLRTCSNDCVAQAEPLASAISAMQPGREKDRYIIAFIKAIGPLAIEDPTISASLGRIAAGVSAGLTETAEAQVGAFVEQVVAALQNGNPGTTTATVADPGFADDPAS